MSTPDPLGMQTTRSLQSAEGRHGFIPIAAPALVGREKEYVLDCLESSWISSAGTYVDAFEGAFARYCGVDHAIACVNGTAALHVALLGLGVAPGDEVICPTLTYVATANAVTYCGAKPVFVDSESATGNLDPARLEQLVTERTRGIIAVHLYGHPADMDTIVAFARDRGLFVVEDAAEAHGAEYRNRRVGSLGDAAVFSFYGNKILTTGEGGMVVTDDPGVADRVRQLKGQGQDPERRYWFPVVGFNYRMTNIAAAIGLAQLEESDWHTEARRTVARTYRKHLPRSGHFELWGETDWARSAYWMNSVVLEPSLAPQRDRLMDLLLEHGVETRPFFYPMHTLPPYLVSGGHSFGVAEGLSRRGLNLPSGALLTDEEIGHVCRALLRSIDVLVQRP